ncbi:ATP-binding cassette domain-containing protein [Uliginosibacterium flavum]|uniref:ATP-binding cassette domain-containing protein n=1 Tax=Uliginosibacterium flavum TaxID=1396831 RepID=A0ABV2THQ9_9RHOO
MEPLLKLVGVQLTLQGRRVLEDVDLSLDAGQIHALLGANAAGKSSLAYAVMGCEGYQPDAGQIMFDGLCIDALPVHERARLGITLAWQEPARFEGLSVRDYLRIGAHGASVEECLLKVGLEPTEYALRAVDKTLSGGERKRIELAAVLAMCPRLVILDEPTAGIDLLSLDALIDLIEALKAGGSSVLLITHQSEVAAHADQASLLSEGRIVCQGKTPDMLEIYRRRKPLRC